MKIAVIDLVCNIQFLRVVVLKRYVSTIIIEVTSVTTATYLNFTHYLMVYI